MRNLVKNSTAQEVQYLAVDAIPATMGKNQLRKKNLARLCHFQPSDYSFVSFMDMCEVFEPKWFKISSKVTSVFITYVQAKDKAFFGKGQTFSEAYEKLMKAIHSYQQEESEEVTSIC